MNTLLNTMFLVLVISGVLSAILQGIFYSRLKKNNFDIWQGLGSPSLVGNYSSCISVMRFFWRQEYRSFSDVQLLKLAGLVRGSMALFMLVFVCTLIVFTLSLWRQP